MIKSNIFYDFTSNYEESKYVIFGVPFDNTSSFRSGSRWAPNNMRKVCYNFESYDYFHDIEMTNIKVHDAGNIDPSGNIKDTLDEIYLEVKSIVEDNKIPIMIGGEHSITYASVKACHDKYKENMIVIVLDAHLDMKIEYIGMEYSHACVSRNIYDKITKKITMIGVRSGTKEEWDFIKSENIKYYTSEDIHTYGIDKIISEIVENNSTKKIYLSIDMDIIDPIYCPGVSTPEPFGLKPYEIKKIINKLAKKILALDIVEMTPEYDNELSSLLSTKLLREYIYSKEEL